MSDIAFLVYGRDLKPGARSSKSFDASTNAGAYVVIDVLNRAGYEVDFCSPSTAHHHDIVLISLASRYDVFHLIKDVARKPKWQDRDFTAVAGGFGMQNVYPLRHYVDYAVFGRCEHFIAEMVEALTEGRHYEHESVMPLEGGVSEVTMGTVDRCYPHEVDTYPAPFNETEMGCPRSCRFCYYSYSRPYIQDRDEAFHGNMGYQSKEVLFDRLVQDSGLKGFTRTAIDGFSERIRHAFRKPITNECIVEQVERVSSEWEGDGALLKVYMLGSFPTETEEDRKEIEDVFRQCDCTGKKVTVNLVVFSFHPAILTPSAYLPVNLETNWNKRTCKALINRDKLYVGYDYGCESPWPCLQQTVIARATEDSDPLINTMVFGKKLKNLRAMEKIRALDKAFDLTPYTREYSIDEELPTWYLTGPVGQETRDEQARTLKQELGMYDD